VKRTASLAALAALATSFPLLAAAGIAQVSIIDRDSGVTLTPHLYHGEYWVVGRPGASYAIEVRNRLGERLLAVMSVDGINVISGATASWDQIGYVFDGAESYQIEGWRKSDAEVAAFTFTDSSNSYAERTGRPANVGVIGIAIFRERQPPAPASSSASIPAPAPASAQARAPASVQAPAPAPSPAPSPSPTSAPPDLSALSEAVTTSRLGTGHGKRETSFINHVEFTRLQPRPDQVIRIHYDSFDNLIAMGIIERPYRYAPAPNPFPASPAEQYVPDPPASDLGR
jgi:hypothetical protein